MPQFSQEYQTLINLLKEGYFKEPESLDLESLADLIQRHKLFPLISKEFVGLLDVDNQARWKEEIRKHTIRSMLLTGELGLVIKQLEGDNIEVVSIKGPVLTQGLYGDIGKRHFGDLDLVVKREDLQKVLHALSGMGYALIHPRSDLTEKQWNYYFRYKKDVGLENRDKRVFVELHVGVYRHELLRVADEGIMFEDMEEEVIGGTSVRCMNKDNTFLYLLYHGGQHLYFRLFWLRDIAEAIKRWDLDHLKILNKAIELGIDRMVGLGLLLAEEFFGTEIPEEYGGYLKKHASILRIIKKLCIQRIYGPENDTFIMRVQRHRYALLLKSGLRYKWAVISSIFHRWYIRKFLGGH